MDFHGTAALEAKLSQTTTGFKSFLLKALNPIFSKKDAGAVIPIQISGRATNRRSGSTSNRRAAPESRNLEF